MLERRGNSPPDAIWEQMLGTNVARESIEWPSSKCRFSSVSSNHGASMCCHPLCSWEFFLKLSPDCYAS